MAFWVGFSNVRVEAEGRINYVALALQVAKFATWPSTTKPEKEFRFCALTNSAHFDLALRGKFVQGMPVLVDVPTDSGGLLQCKAIFVDRLTVDEFTTIKAHITQRPILTIGTDGIGEMITISEQEGKASLTVNLPRLRSAGISMSGEFLLMVTEGPRHRLIR